MPLFVSALGIGAVLGLGMPVSAGIAEALITPVLGLLLYATFLGVPFARIGPALTDWRFLGAALTVNFVVAPAVVWALSRLVAHDRVLLVAVLFVLLTPCVDYVIAFTGLAGGAKDRLLAAAPVLMLGQILLLPVYLWGLLGADFARSIDLGPFIWAFVVLIALPLGAAAVTQVAAARTRAGRRTRSAVLAAMVPLMMLTLAAVVASQIDGVSRELGSLVRVVPVFVLYAVVMIPVGIAAGRVARLNASGTRAVVFSGVTRNSLVVLPLVLALPPEFKLAPLVVVTQTLVELIVMVVCVRLVPRLVPATRTASGRGP